MKNILKLSWLNFILALVLCFACSNEIKLPEARNLTLNEGFENPTGFYDDTPIFSWKLPVAEKVSKQSAYQIYVASSKKLLNDNPDLWNSEKQVNNSSVYIEYEGSKLESRQLVYWKMRYWNQDDQVSKWSEVQTFEIGLLKNSDWQAKWIALDDAGNVDTTSTRYPFYKIQYLRKEFEIAEEIISAKLYITAKGVFEASLNGKKISDDVMPPGWTPYQKRIETLTYDVSNMINKGSNCFGLTLAPGWHSGRLGWMKANLGKSPRIIGQLEIQLKSGRTFTLLTDKSWKGSNNGPITFSEIYDGEIYDARKEMQNWKQTGFDEASWNPVIAEDVAKNIDLIPKKHRTVTTKATLPSLSVNYREDGSAIFDLGQNMVGIPQVNVPVKKGDTLIIRFAEMLDKDGSLHTRNYRGAHSTDYYIPKEDGTIRWQPKFTFHGFRYVSLTGYDKTSNPQKDWVSGQVQYSDIAENGMFTSSHEKLNQLQSNIIWGLRGNFFDIPTDCPQRDERLGWTGDAQVFAGTSIFNADVHAFWASWLQSMREEQGPKGEIPFVIPNVLNPTAVSSGWGDAATVIPWELYMRTGDILLLQDNYEMMKKWVALHELQSDNYISSMNSFGDWLQPFQKAENNRGDTPKELVGTAYFAYSALLTMKTAEVLKKKEDVEKYKRLYETVSKRFEETFFDNNGKLIGTETQTAYLLAIGFGLLSDNIEEKAIPLLLNQIHIADDHLRTGFLGTPLLPKVLDKIGEVELMYTILFQESYPSWFYSIDQGATTMWERWNSYSHADGFLGEKMNSLNHYAYGAIGEWMYERIAGISLLEPGYKKILIAPIPSALLSSAGASYETIYGTLSSSWQIENDQFNLDIVIPPNTNAVVQIPYKGSPQVEVDGKVLKASEISINDGLKQPFIEIETSPGSHRIVSNWKE